MFIDPTLGSLLRKKSASADALFLRQGKGTSGSINIALLTELKSCLILLPWHDQRNCLRTDVATLYSPAPCAYFFC